MASLGVFLLQFAYSQTNYQPGYAITTSGDTLNGLIDYRNWEKNPERISFKSVENAPEQVLGLMEIQGFSVADESYVKATVKVEVSPFKTNDLKEEKEFNFKNATAFLRAIVTGPKSLFYLKDNEGRVCMYIKEGGEYVLLEYKKYLKKVDGKRLITQNQKYVGQLNLYLQDCPEMSAKLSGIEYDPKSIEKRFRIYYECTLEEMDYFRKPDRAKSEWRVVAGAVMTTLKINANNTPLLAEADYDPSLSFAAGVSYDIFITRGQQRWSAYLEFLLTNYNIKGRYENVRNVEYYTYGDLTFAFTHLQFNPMLRYHRPIGNNHLFFNAGLSLGLVMNKKNTVRLEERFYTTHTFTEEPAFPSPRRLEQAVIGGLGFKADRLSLELRLAIGNGFSTVTGIATNTTRYFLMLGYRL